MKPEELKGHLDGLILAVVAGEPLHGYAVIEALKSRSGGALSLPEGTVYPALHRLEADGFLSSEWSKASGRRRRVYSITRRGEKELGASRERWRLFSSTIDAVLGEAGTIKAALSGAVISGAALSGAVITGAVISGAAPTGAGLGAAAIREAVTG